MKRKISDVKTKKDLFEYISLVIDLQDLEDIDKGTAKLRIKRAVNKFLKNEN